MEDLKIKNASLLKRIDELEKVLKIKYYLIQIYFNEFNCLEKLFLASQVHTSS
jgi:hypothetical protein